MKDCPHCSKPLVDTALRCKYCRRPLGAPVSKHRKFKGYKIVGMFIRINGLGLVVTTIIAILYIVLWSNSDWVNPVLLLILMALGLLMIFLGFGVVAHKEWARIPAIILFIIGALDFPMGTLVSGVCLWPLLLYWKSND